jgi:hypothetical protein
MLSPLPAAAPTPSRNQMPRTPSRHQLPRSFQGHPGNLTIHAPAGTCVDFATQVVLIKANSCMLVLKNKPIRFMVNRTSIVLEKEKMAKGNAIVGSVCITKTYPATVDATDKITINEFRYLLEWIIVVSIFNRYRAAYV